MGWQKMTIQEIQKSDRPFLLPADVAEVLQCDPQCIRILAEYRKFCTEVLEEHRNNCK